MKLTRRAALAGLAAPIIAAPALFGSTRLARAEQRVLKLTHQFPASDGDTGDFRDRLVRRFGAEVEKRTNGQIKIEIFPNASLVKTFGQFDALEKGAIDFSLAPANYFGAKIPELNLTFMPAICASYDQAYRWKDAEIGRELTRLIEANGVKVVTWLWQSGGIASRSKAIVRPSDAAGMKIRAGSREMDLMFKAAGATTANMPSNELYLAMQSGAVEAAVTSSTSLLSFKLEELSKHLTAAADRSFFFIFEPILMSKLTFDSFAPEHQAVILQTGADMEPVGRAGALADDRRLEDAFEKAGVAVDQIDAASLAQWRKLAADSAWKDFASRSPEAARFLGLAESA